MHHIDTVTAFDFDANGEKAASIDSFGVCVISDVDTNAYNFHIETEKDFESNNGLC